MKTSEIAKSNNKALEQRFLSSIGKLSEQEQKFIQQEKNAVELVHNPIFQKEILLDSYKVEKLINNQ